MNDDLIKEKFFKAIDSLCKDDKCESCPPFGWIKFTLKDGSIWRIRGTDKSFFGKRFYCSASINSLETEISNDTYEKIWNYCTKKIFSLN